MKDNVEQIMKWEGQTEVVRTLNECLTLIKRDEIFPLPSMFFKGFAGLGKTAMMNAVAECAAPFGFARVEISSNISLPNFITVYTGLLEGQKAVIIIDECDQITKNKKVATLLKRILETDKKPMSVSHDTGHLTANPFQHWWLFASNEEPKDGALFGISSARTTQAILLPYTSQQTINIIQERAERYGMKMNIEAVRYFESRVKHNGRSITHLIDDAAHRWWKLNGRKPITIEAAKEICKGLSLFPGGLDKADIKVLNALARAAGRGSQVAEISAAIGGEAVGTTSLRLRYLAGEGLVYTHGGKKYLTEDAIKYMEKLANLQSGKNSAKQEAKVSGEMADITSGAKSNQAQAEGFVAEKTVIPPAPVQKSAKAKKREKDEENWHKQTGAKPEAKAVKGGKAKGAKAKPKKASKPAKGVASKAKVSKSPKLTPGMSEPPNQTAQPEPQPAN